MRGVGSLGNAQRRLLFLYHNLKVRIDDLKNPEKVLESIRVYLFDELHFRIDQAQDQSRPSLFTDLLEKRKGTPLGLAVLFCTLAEKFGFRVRLVDGSVPHLIRVAAGSQQWIVDLLKNGAFLNRQELVNSLENERQLSNGELSPEWVELEVQEIEDRYCEEQRDAVAVLKKGSSLEI